MKLLTKTIDLFIGVIGSSIGAVASYGIKRGWVYFPFVSEALSIVPFSLGWKFRITVYKKILGSIQNDSVLHFGVIIEDARTRIGSDVWVSSNTYIDYANIGDHVLIGQQAIILAGANQHNSDRIDMPIKLQGNPPKFPVNIGNGAWIGANATIMADIGNDAIVGAGSVVTKPVPPFAIAVGNPAKVLRMRDGLSELRQKNLQT